MVRGRPVRPAPARGDPRRDLGARAWRALIAPDPRGIAALGAERSSELRFLAGAFDRLAREYPSTRDGLSLTERRLLAGAPGTRVALDRLRPLITADGQLTPDGERVLAGESDFVAVHGIDRWIGGVHLRGRSVPWRWDEGSERLIGETGQAVEHI